MPLPLSKPQAKRAIIWLKTKFGNKMTQATANTPFDIHLLCGIACQETAYVWVNWINSLTPQEILGLCVFDASGDYPITVRNAYPRNTAIFRRDYGQNFTNMLIAEANKSRQKRGYSPKHWVYKGYGIFQYDLQYVLNHRSFFEQKKWYNFDECLSNAMKELMFKWKIHRNVWRTIKAYNGSVPRATEYANNVTVFASYSRELI